MSEAIFCGERFVLTDPGHYAWQDMYDVARAEDSESTNGFKAITDFIRACLREDDYPRWETLARRHRSTGEDMMKVVVEALADRPTEQSSDSSDGLLTTAPNSTAASSSPVIERLRGRPDLQLMVLQAQEARAAS